MADTLKLSVDSNSGKQLYWDPSSIVIKSYNTTSSAATPTEAIDSTRTLQEDFLWIDCGGFHAEWQTGAPMNWELYQSGAASTPREDTELTITFGVPFTEPPIVVFGVMSNFRYSTIGWNSFYTKNVTTTGFTCHWTNGVDINTAFVAGLQWIAIGK